ncbi:hypothetical protein GGX14DRAFT_624153 [Mycena pura]|uniref:Fungal-type protein kinase domain-containing protein n=1 Tax=Mycena pura TaxID=153505 RepID=A0AAD6YI17_9AGAR|nr:hypothetical protein GGX14DRAFT_624153 [Mycena pura]
MPWSRLEGDTTGSGAGWLAMADQPREDSERGPPDASTRVHGRLKARLDVKTRAPEVVAHQMPEDARTSSPTFAQEAQLDACIAPEGAIRFLSNFERWMGRIKKIRGTGVVVAAYKPKSCHDRCKRPIKTRLGTNDYRAKPNEPLRGPPSSPPETNPLNTGTADAPPDAPRVATRASTPPKQVATGFQNTPRKLVNALEGTMVWSAMLRNNFAGIHPIDEFLETYLPALPSEPPTKIEDIVSRAAKALNNAKRKLKGATSENAIQSEPLYFTQELIVSAPQRAYLAEVVSNFPTKNKPLFVDTHEISFPSLDKGDRYTKPDITASKPGMDRAPKSWRWQHAGTVIELKYTTDVFDDEGNTNTSGDALIQLANSARSLLMASGSCNVYVVSVFAVNRARIFRFDRTGFTASSKFNWLNDATVFPTFFYRLYNPKLSGRMEGEDDTISIPTADDKRRMYTALRTNPSYEHMYTEEEATADSLWIVAFRFKHEGGERVSELVRCFTIGPMLHNADGLFSRATRVYRVILDEDSGRPNPPIYALKDSWRQVRRRPEIDYYDAIDKYCDDPASEVDSELRASMAQCCGSIDLSIEHPEVGHKHVHHITRSAGDDNLQRCHMRALLTPVGTPLNEFKSPKSLVQAIESAIIRWRVSSGRQRGKCAFSEVYAGKAFLVDWDYAEFTPEGLRNFNKWFPESEKQKSRYDTLDKSLKDMTGTFPFMAIETIKNTVAHGPHHDLESFYWLLVWMILRHTAHVHGDRAMACSRLFDPSGDTTKSGWIQKLTPIADRKSPFFLLTDRFRRLVLKQNPAEHLDDEPEDEAIVPVHLTHKIVRALFTTASSSEKKEHIEAAKQAQNLRKNKLEQQGQRARAKRPHEHSPPVASGSLGGMTAAASREGGSKPKKRRPGVELPQDDTDSMPTVMQTRAKAKGKERML